MSLGYAYQEFFRNRIVTSEIRSHFAFQSDEAMQLVSFTFREGWSARDEEIKRLREALAFYTTAENFVIDAENQLLENHPREIKEFGATAKVALED